jgi:peptidoglycan/LPS O-acetylase OafA/YrhL
MQAWTLSIEAAFYLLFPLFWPLIRRLNRNGTLALAIVAACLIVAFGTPSIGPGVHVVPFLGTDTQIPMPLFRMAEFAYGMALCQMFVRWPLTLSPRTAGIAELGCNYPGPCQGGRSVIHTIHESRGTRRAYEAGVGRVGAAPSAA